MPIYRFFLTIKRICSENKKIIFMENRLSISELK
jgi:hypothetical protein